MNTTMTYAETVDALVATGNVVTNIVQGHIGSGKSSLIKAIAKRLPTHRPVYIDMTVEQEGDIRIPAVNHERKTTTMYYSESYGLDEDAPIILMLDEMGKANNNIKNGYLPVLVDRRFGNKYLHPDSIVFATTNLGAEGVGDMFQAHHRNRMTFIEMSKTAAEPWVKDFASVNGIAPEITMWVLDNPQVFQSFTEVKNPDENVHIFHPKAQRNAFVTHRALEQASHIINRRHQFSANALDSMLTGTIGAPSAAELRAYISMGDQLPRRNEIIVDPENARVPKGVPAMLMLTYQALNWVDANTMDAWMTYLLRMPKEMAALFCTQLVKNDAKAMWAANNDKFTTFAMDNQYAFV